MLTLYGIRSCDTCRKARKWLDANAIEYRVHDVRVDGLNAEMLERWFADMEWQKLLNMRSLTWRRIPEVDRSDMDRDKAMGMMLEQPTLIRRPVLEGDDFIAVGFSPANYAKVFKKP